MNIVLLSGGSGSRLWPLSNEARSKQFLKILKSDQGIQQSMVQRVYEQLGKSGYKKDIFVATNKGQVDSIRDQLGESIELIIEPERRNTWPAIAISIAYLYYKKKKNKDDVVTVLPIDSYAENAYFCCLTELEKVITDNIAELALLGVVPTFPTEKYGYIIPEKNTIKIDDSKTSTVYPVHMFKEKPSLKAAQKFINEDNALWNCGIFAFKIGYILEKISEYINFSSYEDVLNNYVQLEKKSFDYAVVEKTQRVAVVRYDGMWKDLGTWNVLCEEISDASIGNVVLSDDIKNTHVINELEIPTLVLGISDAVVVATYDGILVADKKESPQIKKYLGNKISRPMHEKRRWGEYNVLELSNTAKGQQVLTKKMRIYAGENISYQFHHHRSEIWIITEGKGQFAKNDRLYEVKSGDVLKISAGDKHGIKAFDDITMIEVQIGKPLIEEDIIRIEKDWDKILNICK